jgi:hypothetical protein
MIKAKARGLATRFQIHLLVSPHASKAEKGAHLYGIKVTCAIKHHWLIENEGRFPWYHVAVKASDSACLANGNVLSMEIKNKNAVPPMPGPTVAPQQRIPKHHHLL